MSLSNRYLRALDELSEMYRERRALTKMLGVVTPQNFNQLQYTIPFQTDDVYEDWSPTRPQGFYNNPYYPNLPSTPGGVPLFNTRMRDPDDIEDRLDRFDGDLPLIPSHRSQKKIEREFKRRVRRVG